MIGLRAFQRRCPTVRPIPASPPSPAPIGARKTRIGQRISKKPRSAFPAPPVQLACVPSGRATNRCRGRGGPGGVALLRPGRPKAFRNRWPARPRRPEISPPGPPHHRQSPQPRRSRQPTVALDKLPVHLGVDRVAPWAEPSALRGQMHGGRPVAATRRPATNNPPLPDDPARTKPRTNSCWVVIVHRADVCSHARL